MGTIPNSKTSFAMRRTFEDDKYHVLFIDNVHNLLNYPATKDALQYFFKANQDEGGKIINTTTIHFPFVFNFPIIV